MEPGDNQSVATIADHLIKYSNFHNWSPNIPKFGGGGMMKSKALQSNQLFVSKRQCCHLAAISAKHWRNFESPISVLPARRWSLRRHPPSAGVNHLVNETKQNTTANLFLSEENRTIKSNSVKRCVVLW